jgi:mTERF domain-containing protein, mitochondrial
VVAKLRYYQHLFGSSDKLLRVLKLSPRLLSCSLETVVEPNVAFLRECGVDVRHIASLCINVPRLLTTNPERVQAMAACAEGVGVPCRSGMFRETLQVAAFLSEEEIAAKLEYLKSTFRWSDAEVRIALSRYPSLLRRSKDMLLRKSEFLISKVGLEPAYIARLPVMLCLSLEGRLRPRYYVIMFLMANGLLKRVPKYYPIFKATEKVFFEAYICPHKDAAPQLAEYYAKVCRGEVPTGFTLTGTKNGL